MLKRARIVASRNQRASQVEACFEIGGLGGDARFERVGGRQVGRGIERVEARLDRVEARVDTLGGFRRQQIDFVARLVDTVVFQQQFDQIERASS
jgi:hypothetical protein